MLVLNDKDIAQYRRQAKPGPETPEITPEPEPIKAVPVMPEPAPAAPATIVMSVEAQAAAMAASILKQVTASSKIETAVQSISESQMRLADAVTKLAEQAAKPKGWVFDTERGLNNQITRVVATQQIMGQE